MSVRRAALSLLVLLVLLVAIPPGCDGGVARDAQAALRVVEVHPDDDLQAALDGLAEHPGPRMLRVNEGTYRPPAPGQALVAFNARHDGIVMEAVGEVILTAANPGLADSSAASFPAVVNHVVYFGDGISERTILRGFKITGANGFVEGPSDLESIESLEQLDASLRYSTLDAAPIEPRPGLPKSHYFFTDGGGILIYGRSFPVLENIEVYENYSGVCGGGVSIQHYPPRFVRPVQFKDCIFRDNQAAVSGAAVDLLTPGSWATFENCLFVGNVSNAKLDCGGSGYGALTIFPYCRATVERCTFTRNRAAVDDRNEGNHYRDSIFWRNDLEGGVNPKPPYELDLLGAGGVKGCFIRGVRNDLRSNVSRADNTFDPPDPAFDQAFRPRNAAYRNVGYRPVDSPASGPRPGGDARG